MNRTKKLESDAALGYGCLIHPKFFAFFDKRSGTKRFEVEAAEDGSMPMDRAISLLAIHCVARQQMPKDFEVMIGIGKNLVDGLVERAVKLMRTCAAARTSVPLSRRQRDVLDGIAQNRTNKEIASSLNVSVRTVKFHVSVLLEKFDVRSRVDLMLEAANVLSPDAIHRKVAALEHRPNPESGAAEMTLSPLARPRLPISADSRVAR
jgi:DNA-binding CsgD family transcriptional regulator